MKKKLLLISSLILLCHCEAMFVEDISDRTVVLLAPTHHANITSGQIHFNWTKVPDATEYHVQIAQPNFTDASQLVMDSITTSTKVSKTLEAGSYEWRVSAVNTDYATNYTTNSFTAN